MLLLCTVAGISHAQETVTQTFTLHPGWNAIWLEVRPTNTEVAAVFDGVPIESVWTFQERLSAVDFIQDTSEPVWNKDRWLVYVPTNRIESFQNNLYHIQVNRAYLVRLEGNSDVTLAVTGRPSLRLLEWAPNAYNLRGFPINPAGTPPSFLNFFRPSAAHYDAAAGALRKIYRLSTAGQWRLVAPTDQMRAGEACWVYTQGASDYQGPLSARLEVGDALEYGYGSDRLSLIFRNLSASAVTVSLNNVGPTAPLSFSSFDPLAGVQWLPLASPHDVVLAASEQQTLRLAARRADMAEDSYASVLTISDGAGVRYLVPVTIRKVMSNTIAPQPAPPGGRFMASPPAAVNTHVGLWVGSVTVSNVSEAHGGVLVTNYYAYAGGQPLPLSDSSVEAGTNYVISTNVWVAVTSNTMTLKTNLGAIVTNTVVWARSTNGTPLPVYRRVERVGAGTTPTPTKNPFTLRLIIHVDADGQARLLKEVIQMWKEGTYTNTADGWKVMEKAGNYVLITDENLLSQFQGAAERDGQSVGRRISSVDFDFPSTNNCLALTGAFEVGQTNYGTIVLPDDFATNPFRHKYHPDHAKGYAITRQLQFSFAAASSSGAAQTTYGYDTLEGTYWETVSGLHKSDIVASGSFILNRVDITPYLNR